MNKPIMFLLLIKKTQNLEFIFQLLGI